MVDLAVFWVIVMCNIYWIVKKEEEKIELMAKQWFIIASYTYLAVSFFMFCGNIAFELVELVSHNAKEWKSSFESETMRLSVNILALIVSIISALYIFSFARVLRCYRQHLRDEIMTTRESIVKQEEEEADKLLIM